MANLFTGQTPAVTNADDGAPGILTATGLLFAVSGQVTGIRFYATTTISGAYTAQLYQTTAAPPSPAGTLLASKVGGTPASGTWNTITFDTPVSVSAGIAYQACIHSSAGRYVATTGFFASALTNGDITGYANNSDPVLLGSLSQGSFLINATPGYPTSSGGGACYFVDVEFTADGAGPVTPNSLRTGIALGAPTVVNRLTVRPDALRAGVRPGAPTVTTPAPEPGTTTGGDWDGYGAVLAYAREQHRINQERLRSPVECPADGWPLIRTSRGYYCEFGGHIVAPR